jgi:hypothetical protein
MPRFAVRSVGIQAAGAGAASRGEEKDRATKAEPRHPAISFAKR